MKEQDSKKDKQEIKRTRGFLNPRKVKTFVFITITLCIVLGVLVSILAI